MATDLLFAFDAVETSFSVEPLRPHLQRLGLPPQGLEWWFSQWLRDCFALQVTEQYVPFPIVGRCALEVLLATSKLPAPEDALDEMMVHFRRLPAHPDLLPALQRVEARGGKAILLSNLPEATAKLLVENAGADPWVDRVVSADDVKAMKPAARVYEYAAERFDRGTAQVAVLSAHDWDVHGAKQARCLAGFVRRGAASFSPVMRRPDAEAESLVELVDSFVELRELGESVSPAP